MLSPKTLLSEFIAMTAHNGVKVEEKKKMQDFCCETVDNSVPATHDFRNHIEIKLAKIHIIRFIWMRRVYWWRYST